MCFNQPMTLGFSIMGLVASCVVFYKSHNWCATLGVFYFFLMEFLQFFQYFWVDQCNLKVNQFLTFLGILHIAFQPYFGHLILYGSIHPTKEKGDKKVAKFILKLCLVAGIYMMVRFFLGYYGYYVNDNIEGFGYGYDENGDKMGTQSACGISTEWLRGKELCTYSGRRHIAWSIPFASASYFMPSMFIHFFCMFIPFFIDGRSFSWVYGTVLFLTGPFLAYFFSDDLMEQPAIWCFCSMTQTVVLTIFVFVGDTQSDFFYTLRKNEEEEDDNKKVN